MAAVIDSYGSVVGIGPRAFAGCTGLWSVNISEGVQYIGNEAFEGKPVPATGNREDGRVRGRKYLRKSGVLCISITFPFFLPLWYDNILYLCN